MYSQWYKRGSAFNLSPFLDASMALLVTALMVEVKGPNGDYFEAAYQAGLASITVFNNLKAVNPTAAIDGLLPIPSIVVIGHDWKLHFLHVHPTGTSVSPPFRYALKMYLN